MIDYHHKKADKILHHTYPSLHNQSILKVLNLQFKTELSCNWTIVTGELRLNYEVIMVLVVMKKFPQNVFKNRKKVIFFRN